jgi:hypothetical protein
MLEQLRTITPVVMPSTVPFRNPEHRELFLSGLRLWRDNLDENGAAIRMRSGGRDASWSRRTRTDASPL